MKLFQGSPSNECYDKITTPDGRILYRYSDVKWLYEPPLNEEAIKELRTENGLLKSKVASLEEEARKSKQSLEEIKKQIYTLSGKINGMEVLNKDQVQALDNQIKMTANMQKSQMETLNTATNEKIAEVATRSKQSIEETNKQIAVLSGKINGMAVSNKDQAQTLDNQIKMAANMQKSQMETLSTTTNEKIAEVATRSKQSIEETNKQIAVLSRKINEMEVSNKDQVQALYNQIKMAANMQKSQMLNDEINEKITEVDTHSKQSLEKTNMQIAMLSAKINEMAVINRDQAIALDNQIKIAANSQKDEMEKLNVSINKQITEVAARSATLEESVALTEAKVNKSVKEKPKIAAGERVIYCGAESKWIADSTPGSAYVSVDYSHLHLGYVPKVFTSLSGSAKHFNTLGTTSIYDLTKTGFKVYVTYNDALAKVDIVNVAETKNWQLQYVLICP